jgi:hypothetical protein
MATPLRAFGSAILSSTFARLSGAASVPLAFFGVFAKSDTVKEVWTLTVLACCWIAAYSVWHREWKARLDAEDKLKPIPLKLKFQSCALSIESPGQQRWVALLSVKNETGAEVHNCIVQYIFDGESGEHSYTLCDPFDLVIDQNKDVPFAYYTADLQKDDSTLTIPTFGSINNGGLVIHNNSVITLQILSSNTRSTRLSLKAHFTGAEWQFA